jgi:hypothetical protein
LKTHYKEERKTVETVGTDHLQYYIYKAINGQAVFTQEAKYVKSWPSTAYAWAGWSRFDILVDIGMVEYCTFPANLHRQHTGVSYLPPG